MDKNVVNQICGTVIMAVILICVAWIVVTLVSG
jgi:hypothetical protein